jgi:hypothetical protein
MSERKKIAAMVTTYYPASHADAIVTKFLTGFPTDDGMLPPQVDIASMYIDQIHERDIGVALAQAHGVPIYKSIPQALTLGGKDLAVDGVLLIGEHGDYAWNEKLQHLYPRRYFFEQICGVMATSGRSVPVFNDKHLSYNWADATWMVNRARELDVPLMAGSSLPLCWRKPMLEHALETPLEEALSTGYGSFYGRLDSYGFHALELLQCMVERRKGGETGIVAVQCLEGQAVWQARDQGRWSGELAQAVFELIEDKKEDPIEEQCREPAAFVIEYADGLRATTLMLDDYTHSWGYACRTDGQAQVMRVLTPGAPYAHFSYLSLNIQEMFLTRKPQYPVERTLLVSGALEALMESRYRGHVRVPTPHLDVRYRSYDQTPIRPTVPSPQGASLGADRQAHGGNTARYAKDKER